MLTPEDIEALKTAVVAAIGQKLDELDANLGRRFDDLDVRLFALETRVGRIEERLAQLVGSHTRARTTDIDRIAALEARVADLEQRLAGR